MIDPDQLRTPLLRRILTMIREERVPDYCFADCGPLPWTEVTVAARDLRVALITSGGLHLAGDDAFRVNELPLGDPDFRVIPHLTPAKQLALDAIYVEQKYAPKDPEVALPMAALDSLANKGTIGAAAAHHYSFCGGVVQPLPGLADSAERLSQLLHQDKVNAVVLLPTCSLCVQTVCVVARELERRGFATVTLSLIPELSEIVGAPRVLTIKFPFGAPCGDPQHRDLHRAVLVEALQLLTEAAEPGETRASRHAWRRSPG